MTRSRLSITVVDHRPGKDGSVRSTPRTRHYTDHTEFLRDMGRLARVDGLTSEETQTTVHIYPRTSAVQAALFGGAGSVEDGGEPSGGSGG